MKLHHGLSILLTFAILVIAVVGRLLLSWNPKRARGWIVGTSVGLTIAAVALLVGYGYIPL